MAQRSRFKRYDNKTKTYHLKRTPEETLAFAQKCRQERLANETLAERSFAGILAENAIPFEREVIFINGDRFILCDFSIRDYRGNKICVEIDGGSHKHQAEYDRGRDKWLMAVHNIKTVRFANKEVLNEPEKIRAVLQSKLSL